MTYNEIVTPIKKNNYGEADIIYTFLTSTHGRVDAIAKGIRKSTSRKRGNIEFGAFSKVQFAKGKNLDVLTEAQMIELNDELITAEGLKFLYTIIPIINKFATDIDHTTRIFETVKKIFILYEKNNQLLNEIILKYHLLNIQDILPEWNKCAMCKVIYDELSKYSSQSYFLICNNCARKVESYPINCPKSEQDLTNYNTKDQQIILNILNSRISSFIKI